MDNIRIAIVGVGNCASSLVQGIYYYKEKDEDDPIGLMHWEIGGYCPGDIEGLLMSCATPKSLWNMV